MNSLTKTRTRRERRIVSGREAIQEKERAFWKKESGFYIRLLRQCESLCDKMEAEKYRNLIGQFQSFQEGTFQRLFVDRGNEVRIEFNPLNQSYIRREVKSSGSPDHSAIKERFQELKEEAFQKIGRFFTVKIR